MANEITGALASSGPGGNGTRRTLENNARNSIYTEWIVGDGTGYGNRFWTTKDRKIYLLDPNKGGMRLLTGTQKYVDLINSGTAQRNSSPSTLTPEQTTAKKAVDIINTLAKEKKSAPKLTLNQKTHNLDINGKKYGYGSNLHWDYLTNSYKGNTRNKDYSTAYYTDDNGVLHKGTRPKPEDKKTEKAKADASALADAGKVRGRVRGTAATLSQQHALYYDKSQQDDFNNDWEAKSLVGNRNAWGKLGKVARGTIGSNFNLDDSIRDAMSKMSSDYGEAGQLQKFLISLGYSVTEDGYAGKLTLAALNDYKKREEARLAKMAEAEGPQISSLDRQYTNFLEPTQVPMGDGTTYTQTSGYGNNIDRGPGMSEGGTTLSGDYAFEAGDIKNASIRDWNNLSSEYALYLGDPNTYSGNKNFMNAFSAFVKTGPKAGLEGSYLNEDGTLNLNAIESTLGISGRYYGGDRRRILAGITGGLSALDDQAQNAMSNFKRTLDSNGEFKLEALNDSNNYVWMGDGDNRKLYFKNGDEYFTAEGDTYRRANKNYTYDQANLRYNITYNKQGGKMNINYFLAGGQMAAAPQLAAPAQGGEDILAQVAQLVQAAMSGDQKATEAINQIMQAAQLGDQLAAQLAQMIQEIAQQMQGQTQVAKLGAKLGYIHSLKTGCPEGTEAVYTMKNGGVCKACVKKAAKAKCGGKSKKCETGAELEKCGGKAKKKYFGGSVESDKCGGKAKKAACGSKAPKAACGTKTKKCANGGLLEQIIGYFQK